MIRPFGAVHLAIVVAVPALALALAATARRSRAAARGIRLGLVAVVCAAALVGYGHELARGSLRPPRGLPLELCDVIAWLTVYALVTARQWAEELVYYLGLTGTGMALLTPDLGPTATASDAVAFFLAHGGVVTAVLFLVWSGALVPGRGAWLRALLTVNAYAALLGAFDALFDVNYMYLCRKPAAGSALDAFGPWPWYLVGGEGIAVAAFALLDLPFRAERRRPRPG